MREKLLSVELIRNRMNVHELEGNFYESTGITENLISGGFRRRILVFEGREGKGRGRVQVALLA